MDSAAILEGLDADDFECSSPLLTEPVLGRHLLAVCLKLKKAGGWQSWPKALVLELATLLAGRAAGIIGYGAQEDRAGADAFVDILDDWQSYSQEHAWVRPIVDPTYLEVDVSTGPGQPGNLAAPVLPAVYPPPDSGLPALVPVGGGGFSWAFAAGALGMAHAHHFAGALQALNPGLAIKIYTTSSSPVMWR